MKRFVKKLVMGLGTPTRFESNYSRCISSSHTRVLISEERQRGIPMIKFIRSDFTLRFGLSREGKKVCTQWMKPFKE
jgi:hypothetical protein